MILLSQFIRLTLCYTVHTWAIVVYSCFVHVLLMSNMSRQQQHGPLPVNPDNKTPATNWHAMKDDVWKPLIHTRMAKTEQNSYCSTALCYASTFKHNKTLFWSSGLLFHILSHHKWDQFQLLQALAILILALVLIMSNVWCPCSKTWTHESVV